MENARNARTMLLNRWRRNERAIVVSLLSTIGIPVALYISIPSVPISTSLLVWLLVFILLASYGWKLVGENGRIMGALKAIDEGRFDE